MEGNENEEVITRRKNRRTNRILKDGEKVEEEEERKG